MTLLSRRVLSRAKTLDFLVELEKMSGDEAWSLYLPPGLPQSEEVPEQMKIFPEIVELARNSKTGAVLFWSSEHKYLVLPPFPVTARTTTQGILIEPLHSMLKHNYRIALVLVRLGAYAIGIGDSENLANSKVGTGLVHGRHKKGGSSQARFRRHREKQIESFLIRVCRHAREQLEPQATTLDYIVYGGARTTIQLLQKQCPFLEKLNIPALPPLLEIPEPRQAVLSTAISRVWSSTVVEWQEDY